MRKPVLEVSVLKDSAYRVPAIRRVRGVVSALVIGLLASGSSQAEVPAPITDEEFRQCLTQLQSKAQAKGVSPATVNEVLGKARYLKNVIGYDRNQPEFVQTFPNYLNKRVTDWRINKGRELFAKHQSLLNQLSRTYGVPAHYLVAFWGLETNFGNYKGKMPIIDSLATLACDKRRSTFFTGELMVALELYERENLSTDKMVGSWAGAMGHTQFMPSAYMRFAVDGDNDGAVDLWESEPDALTSAANFLKSLGWQAGYRWGREVKLPEDFDYAKAGRDRPLPLSAWNELGVAQANGDALGNAQIEASLLVPAGHQGPAFLVYRNFDVIMRWNNSESYALAVGYLADRISGQASLVTPLPEMADYAIEDVRLLQQQLNALGYDVGTPDGIIGPATRKGIRQFQIEKNLVADGFANDSLFDAVNQASETQQPNA